MINNKYISKLIAVIMAAAVIFCFLAMFFSKHLEAAWSGKAVAVEYEAKLFDTEKPMQIDIQMEKSDWDEMLLNAMAEEYYRCDVVIDGQKFYSVAVRPKGNTSLSSIAMDETTDRFSLKLEFDHYVAGQTCYGLDKLVLNNNFADATNMKEAIVYDMYRYLDVDASLYNYAEISLNGDYWGVYLALESVEDSFLLRNYGTGDGKLYKPEGMDGGRADGAGDAPVEVSDREPGNVLPPDGTAGNMQGADLNYTDDDPDSYSIIWEGEVTKTDQADHKRVIAALKHASEGTDLETYLDIDNILKYMAVHTFSVNLDSLSGNMAHNYYLYEYDGCLNILPWDYNLAFGGMTAGAASGASEIVNAAVDTPFQGTQFFDALLEHEEYQAQYHAYLQQLVEEYVVGGKFDETYTRIRSQIDELVKTDPTAFYSYDAYTAGAEMLYQTVMLRAKSIRGQMQGEIPSTDEGQKEDASHLVDASEIDINAMGVFRGGGNGGHSKIFAGIPQEAGEDKQTQEAFSDSVPQLPSGFADRAKQHAIRYAVCFLVLCIALILAKVYVRK